MTNGIENETTGPLRLPAPQDTKTRLAITEQLHGHTTSADWLPEGLLPELDELRAEQLRLRGQVVGELDALRALGRKFNQEDSEHAERFRQAQREGRPLGAEDHRRPAGQRAAARAAIYERLWAGVEVFAEHAQRVIETVREHEDEWLADLRSRASVAEAKRREAERLLAEAKAEEFHVHRLGQWVQATADDVGFGRQPAEAAAVDAYMRQHFPEAESA